MTREFRRTETLSKWCQGAELFLRRVEWWLCFAVGQIRLGACVARDTNVDEKNCELDDSELFFGAFEWVIRTISEEQSSSNDVDGKFRKVVGIWWGYCFDGRVGWVFLHQLGRRRASIGRVWTSLRESTQWSTCSAGDVSSQPATDVPVPLVTFVVNRWRSWSAGEVPVSLVTFWFSQSSSYSADNLILRWSRWTRSLKYRLDTVTEFWTEYIALDRCNVHAEIERTCL